MNEYAASLTADARREADCHEQPDRERAGQPWWTPSADDRDELSWEDYR